MRTLALLLAAFALGIGGCVNGVRSGTPPAADAVAAPAVAPAAPAVQPPPPPESATPPAAPTPMVWRAEYYKISDG